MFAWKLALAQPAIMSTKIWVSSVLHSQMFSIKHLEFEFPFLIRPIMQSNLSLIRLERGNVRFKSETNLTTNIEIGTFFIRNAKPT